MKGYQIIDPLTTMTGEDRLKYEEDNPDWWHINNNEPPRKIDITAKAKARKANRAAGRARHIMK